jgi:hypothetical protein
VLPTTAKTGDFDNPVICNLWHSAYRALVTARLIFVIGYSLPPADGLVRSMLAAALGDTGVWIVNPMVRSGNALASLASDLSNEVLWYRPLVMSDVVAHHKNSV